MATQVTDPVCGMSVDPEKTPHTAEYKGETYYFCSPGCKKAFEADPVTYVPASDHRR